MEIQCRRQQ